MRELVEYIVKQLVNNPDAVIVEERAEPGMVNFLLTVDPQDMGIVIGKAGQTIKAVRRLLTIRAISENVRVNLELKEVGGKPSEQESPTEAEEQAEETPETKEETEVKDTPQEEKTPTEE